MDHDPFDIDEKRRRERFAEGRRALRLAEERDDLREVMSSEKGRRFVRRVISQLGRRDATFETDQLLLARRAGRNEFALALETLIETSLPEQALQMHSERLAEARQLEDEYRNSRQS